jgi:hypothetical protein
LLLLHDVKNKIAAANMYIMFFIFMIINLESDKELNRLYFVPKGTLLITMNSIL